MAYFTGTAGFTNKDSESSFEPEDADVRRACARGGAKAPNIVYIVLDDVGFSQLGCFGSSIHTPNIDRLARRGLRYSNFHTTAICSATRASLLTGANHHSVGVSTVVDTLSGEYPNQLGYMNPHFATTAEVLREYGYTNFCVGKWHLAPFEQCTDAGPFDNWPLQRGFDRYYGFLAGYTDQYHPDLVQDNESLSPAVTQRPGYTLSKDLADHAISYVYRQHAVRPDDPFFLYFALGAAHAPHQAPREYIDRYRGAFDKGWDAIRAEWLENQKRLGIVPKDTELSERNEYAPAWDSLTGDEKRVYARYMEVFAGFLEYADSQIGRVIDYLEAIGVLDNTLVVLLSDNGASAEGGQNGRLDQEKSLNLVEQTDNVARSLPHLDELGGEYTDIHYPVGWANAGNTPFKWYKSFAFGGGVNDPLIISWPDGIDGAGEIRNQFCHVSDIAPTVLDVLGVRKPDTVRGVTQQPYQGQSLAYTFGAKGALEPARKHVQYFEQAGSRGIYKDGWKAIARHDYGADYLKDTWELYNVSEDFSECHDLAAEHPDKLEELKALWYVEAGKYGVLPMGPGPYLLATPEQMHNMLGSKKQAAFYLEEQHFGYDGLIEPLWISAKTLMGRRNYRIDATFSYKAGDAGVLYQAGNRFGGYVLYVKDGRVHYALNANRERYFTIDAAHELPEGEVRLRLNFAVQADGTALARLYVNGDPEGETQVTQHVFMMEAQAKVKDGVTSAVVDDYGLPFEYPRDIDHFEITAAPAVVDAEDYLNRFFAID